MSTVATPTITFPPPALPMSWSLANLQEHLGGIPLERIRMYPPLGMATVEDALRLGDRDGFTCELVDGVLVEKAMGAFESALAATLIYFLMDHLNEDTQGVVLGEDGTLKILPTKMRMPDVSFIRWDTFPDGKMPDQPVPEVAPDLAVEIISAGNTAAEMEKKLDEYFEAGVKLVWYIYPKTKTARIYTARQQVVEIDENGSFSGENVLPGFTLRLGDLFERTTRQSNP